MEKSTTDAYSNSANGAIQLLKWVAERLDTCSYLQQQKQGCLRHMGTQYRSQAVNEDEGLELKCTSYNSRSHGEVLLLDSNQVSYLLS